MLWWNSLLAAVPHSQASPSSQVFLSSLQHLSWGVPGAGFSHLPGPQYSQGGCVLTVPGRGGSQPHGPGALTQNKLLGTFS